MTEIHIRVAALEADVARIKIAQEKSDQTLEDIRDTVVAIQTDLSRYKGFLGGIMFAVSCLVAFIRGIPYLGTLFGHK